MLQHPIQQNNITKKNQGKLLALFSSGFAICSCPPKKHHKNRWIMNPSNCDTPRINSKPTGVFFEARFLSHAICSSPCAKVMCGVVLINLSGCTKPFLGKSWRDSAGVSSVFFCGLEGRSFKRKLVSHSVHGWKKLMRSELLGRAKQ